MQNKYPHHNDHKCIYLTSISQRSELRDQNPDMVIQTKQIGNPLKKTYMTGQVGGGGWNSFCDF
jgi:hypothetical protein